MDHSLYLRHDAFQRGSRPKNSGCDTTKVTQTSSVALIWSHGLVGETGVELGYGCRDGNAPAAHELGALVPGARLRVCVALARWAANVNIRHD